jgi:hypothetical protein
MNGLGNGPLNDYGRALWSAEIASHWFYPKTMSDEDLAEQSGFLGKPDRLPLWFRPFIKYRSLQVTTGLQSSNENKIQYKMQQDLGLVSSTESGKYALVVTAGYLQKRGEPYEEKYSLRESYIRFQAEENLWLYAGVLEKVFGLRNIDHSSYQRTYQGFNPKLNSVNGVSQAQGLVIHKVEEKWEISANAFAGHPLEEEKYRQVGGSLMGEWESSENGRMGGSVLSAKSDVLKKDLVAFHYRKGLGNGHAFQFEYGFIQDQLENQNKTLGSYNLLESSVLLNRGYNLRALIERYNQEFKSTSPDIWRWGLGFLAFPAPRLELRVDLIHGRNFYEGPASQDTWTMQGQLHVSL